MAQEVFVRLSARISDFDRERDGLSWAFGIAAYEIMTLRRRRQRRREESGASGLERQADTATSQEEAVVKHELGAALGWLDEPATRLASEVATRKRRQRALDHLRTAWRRIHGQP